METSLHIYFSFLRWEEMGFVFPLLLAVSSHHTLLLRIAVSEQCSFLRLQILIPLTP